MVIEVITCRHCAEATNVAKNGFAPNNGKQKYLCHACGRQSREDPSSNGATPKSARRRSCAPTRSDLVSGGSGAPSASRPPRSSAGSKKVADLGDPKDTLMLSEGSVEDKVLELDELSLVLRLWQVRKSVDLAGPLAGLTPAAKGERRQPAPPSLVLEAHRPPRLVLGQADQSVAASFFGCTRGGGSRSTVLGPLTAPPASPVELQWLRACADRGRTRV